MKAHSKLLTGATAYDLEHSAIPNGALPAPESSVLCSTISAILTSRSAIAFALYTAIAYFVIATSLRQVALFIDYTSPLGLRDIGIFQQALHNFITNGTLDTSLGSPNNPQSLFGEHAFLLIFLLVPLYYVFQSPLSLMLSQPLAYLFMMFVVYRILKDLYKEHPTVIQLTLILLLLNPAFHVTLQNFNIYGFHLEFYFPALFLTAYYFYEARNTRLFILFYLLSLGVIEYYSVVWIGFFAYRILVKRNFGSLEVALLFCSSIYLAFMFFGFIPYFKGTSLPWYARQLSASAASVHPRYLLNLPLLEFAKVVVIHTVFNYACFLFLPFKNKETLIVLFPVYLVFAVSFLNGYIFPLSAGSWHANALYPIILLGFIHEIRKLRQPLQGPALAVALCTAILVTGAIQFWRPAYNQGLFTLLTKYETLWTDYKNIQAIKSHIRNEPILVSFQLGKYFGDFTNVALLDELPIKDTVQYILYYAGGTPLSERQLGEIQRDFIVTKSYKDIILFERLVSSNRGANLERSTSRRFASAES